MAKIKLVIPKIEELYYRKKLLEDKDTMSYNKGFDLDIKGYDKETGIIIKTDEELEQWYYKWVNNEPNRFYYYIYDIEKNKYVGEIYCYYNSDLDMYDTGVVVESINRGNNYCYESLIEFERIVFEEYNINALSDIIPIDRVGAIKSFKKAGFKETELIKEEFVFGEKQLARQLLITREDYLNRR